MGIPYLIKSLLGHLDDENNKKLTMPFYRVKGKVFHSFFVDFNSLFYKAYAKVSGTHPESFILQEQFSKHLTKEQAETLIIEETLKLFETILKDFRILNTLYIGIDGTVPNAKMVQQRQRRFRHAAEHKKARFDTNAFSPGTKFMRDFDDAMKRWIDAHGYDIAPTIVYSSHLTPNEAEHKIMSYIRKNLSNLMDEIGIYGLDGDLLMLSLVAPVKNIFLLREDINQVIIINEFRNAIYQRFKATPEFNQLDYQQAINDFILIMSIFGNDFMSKPVSFSDIDKILGLILERRSQIKAPISNTDGSFDVKRLMKIYEVLNEDELLLAKAANNYIYPDPFLDETAEVNRVEENGEIVKYPVSLNYGRYRSLWYNNLLKTTASVNPNIKLKNEDDTKKSPAELSVMLSEVVKAYLTTIAWIFRYYTQGTKFISQVWFYPYTHAPMLKDLVNTKFVYDQLGLHHRDKKESNPVIQLLAILPPSSKMLLTSPNMRKFMSDPLLEGYYNENFSIQRFGTNESWQGTAIISPADVLRIENVIRLRQESKKLYDDTAFYDSSVASALIDSEPINMYMYQTGAESDRLEKLFNEHTQLLKNIEVERKKINREDREYNKTHNTSTAQTSNTQKGKTFFNNSSAKNIPTQNINTKLPQKSKLSSQSATSSSTIPTTQNTLKQDKSQNTAPHDTTQPSTQSQNTTSGRQTTTQTKTRTKSPTEGKSQHERVSSLSISRPAKNEQSEFNQYGNKGMDKDSVSLGAPTLELLFQYAIKLSKARKNQFKVLSLYDDGKDADLWIDRSVNTLMFFDTSNDNLNQLRANEKLKGDVTTMFFDSLPNITKKVPTNIIVSIQQPQLFENVVNAKEIIQLAKRVLKPSGVFLVYSSVLNGNKETHLQNLCAKENLVLNRYSLPEIIKLAQDLLKTKTLVPQTPENLNHVIYVIQNTDVSASEITYADPTSPAGSPVRKPQKGKMDPTSPHTSPHTSPKKHSPHTSPHISPHISPKKSKTTTKKAAPKKRVKQNKE